MLNIEIVRFEAQDVITTSVAAPECSHEEIVPPANLFDLNVGDAFNVKCGDCGATGVGTVLESGIDEVEGYPFVSFDLNWTK